MATCRLLALPPELRNEIYRLALEGTTTTVTLHRSASQESTSASPDNTDLIFTSKQFYAEAKLVYYSTVQLSVCSQLGFLTWAATKEARVKEAIAGACVRVYVPPLPFIVKTRTSEKLYRGIQDALRDWQVNLATKMEIWDSRYECKLYP